MYYRYIIYIKEKQAESIFSFAQITKKENIEIKKLLFPLFSCPPFS